MDSAQTGTRSPFRRHESGPGRAWGAPARRGKRPGARPAPSAALPVGGGIVYHARSLSRRELLRRTGGWLAAGAAGGVAAAWGERPPAAPAPQTGGVPRVAPAGGPPP